MKYCRCGCVKHDHTATGCLVCPCTGYEEGPAPKAHEAVNHPSHYTFGKYEVIDVIADWKLSFCEGNVVKYTARARHKGKELEDLQKARFYLNYRISELEESEAAEKIKKAASTFLPLDYEEANRPDGS